MIQAIIAAVAIAFSLGGGLGIWGTYRWYHVSQLEAQVDAYKEGQRKTAEALNFTTKQDDEADTIEKANKEIVDAILAKKDPPHPVPVECIDAASMRDIGKLR